MSHIPFPPELPRQSLERAIQLAGGPSRLAAAATLAGPRKVERQHIGNWLQRGNGWVSADYVIQVAKAVGFAVSPHQLRPDLYPHPTDGLPKEVDGEPSTGAEAGHHEPQSAA